MPGVSHGLGPGRVSSGAPTALRALAERHYHVEDPGCRSCAKGYAMHVYVFHLMPWPYLPEDFAQNHDTAWVVCENELYDPVRGHEVYNRYLDELELADQLGFDGVCVNEHHQNAYGLMPSPNVMAASLARRTRQGRLVIVANVLTLCGQP